jgi:hypothetical protein
MSFYSLKHALQPAKIDAAVDKTEAMPTAAAVTALTAKLTPNQAGLIISTLPTTNPNVAGALWVNNNVVTVSAG